MSLLINIIITLIGITIVIVAFYNYIPVLEKFLAEKLKLSLFKKSKDHGVLGQIFYKYNHKDAGSWVEWAKTQDASVQEEAINLLIKHIDNIPAIWGSVTPEAIKALGKFEKIEHISIMKSILNACKKMWKKYKICEASYEAALIGIVSINLNKAKISLKDEIKEIEEEAQAIAICNTLSIFPEEEDINQLFVDILTNQNITRKSRNYAINIANKRSEEQAHLTFIETVKKILESKRALNEEDISIFETLLNLITKEITSDSFNLLRQACSHEDLSKTSINSLSLILKSNFSEFNSEQLYTLINLKKDESQSLFNTIADFNKLTADEKSLCEYYNFDEIYPFKKAPIVKETKTTTLEPPECIAKILQNFMDALKEHSTNKQNGTTGGIVLSGYSDLEKLCIARVAASQRKWHFIYAAVEDVMASGSTAKSMLDAILTSKPCILYLDEINILIKNLDNPLVKQLKTLATDPLVNIIATLKDNVEINDKRLCTLFINNSDLQYLFPITIEIGLPNDASKNILLQEKIAKLNHERKIENIENYQILDSTNNISLFELDKYLTKYFRASILCSNQLISKVDFEKLDSLEFEGRGDL
jgi:hypothetical protein